MVRWFNPLLLLDTARQAVASALFGQYADRRLVHAALDTRSDNECTARYDFSSTIVPDNEGNIWFDYVADLGDGFDSTYAIAYLLGQRLLEIDGEGELPRGQLLVMGGDQVYPTATRENYKERFQFPYESAFPDSQSAEANHPAVFLLPGNHDWYDGLVLFLAKFCRGRSASLGSWRAIQHRSYFAIKLPYNWWIWGIDTQLTQDIDLPQANYFVAVARRIPENAKIILCSSVPSWLKADEANNDEFYRGVEYIANIAKDESPSSRILAVISGDKHHYSRYSADQSGPQFIVSGGGGAFLHPTHQLSDTIRAKWQKQWTTLCLKTAPAAGHKAVKAAACYPSKENSQKLLYRNFYFVVRNPEFCLTLGALYALSALILMIRHIRTFDSLPEFGLGLFGATCHYARAILISPEFFVLAAGFLVIFFKYADGRTRAQKFLLSVPHAACHILIALMAASFIPPLNVLVLGIEPETLGSFLVSTFEISLITGFFGGFVWGAYLLFSCRTYGRHTNDAFSAMRLNKYRNFLRVRISKNSATIFPIGLDDTPHRSSWRVNANARHGNQDEPAFVPKHPLRIRLIEGPVSVLTS
jgi:hypothetical protein